MIGLLVDDEESFLRTLQRSLDRHQVRSVTATSAAAALAAAQSNAFDFALVDLKIGKDSGLKLIAPLRATGKDMRIVMMTGYASVATAVEAIKAGADDYLLKPVNVDVILRAITDEPRNDVDGEADEAEAMTPLSRIEWEHIQQALRATDGNISAAARLLGVQRRSLQRKLAKRPLP